MSLRRTWPALWALSAFVLLAGVLLAGVLLAGCPEQGRRTGIQFTVVPAGACGTTLLPMLSSRCFQIEVCETDNPSVCVAVAPVGGPYPAPEDDAGLPLWTRVPATSGALTFDARAEPGQAYDIDMIVFGEASESGLSSPVAVGHASGVILDGGGAPATVRLYPATAWSCPGNGGDVPPRSFRRAFHESVALSNGDVLIIGGIAIPDDGVSPAVVGASAGLVEGGDSVWVYDSRAEQLLPVTIVDGDAALLSRVAFQARWVQRTGRGRELVRVIGGVMGSSTLTFAVGAVATSRYPLAIGESPVPAPIVDLEYDAEAHTIELSMTGDPVNAVLQSPTRDLPAEDQLQVAGLFGGGGLSEVTRFGNENASRISLAGPALASPLSGATITGIGSAGTSYLVYGGNRAQTGTDQDLGRAFVLDSTGTPNALTAPASLRPSGLHTASSIDAETVLYVGGLALVDATVVAPSFPVLRGITYDTVALTELTVSIPAVVEPSRIYHSATLYRAPGASRNSVVVVGGTTATEQLQALGTAFVVDLGAATPVRPLPALQFPRFGHSTALLRGGRVLVTGGLRRGTGADSSKLVGVTEVELMVVRPLPDPLVCDAASMDAGTSEDAGRDAQVMSRPDAGRDAALSTGDAAQDAPGTDDAGS